MEFRASRRRFRRETWLISVSALVMAPLTLYFIKGVTDPKMLLGIGLATGILTLVIYEYRARRFLVGGLEIDGEAITIRRRNVVTVRWSEVQEAVLTFKQGRTWSLYDGKRTVHFSFDGIADVEQNRAHRLILDHLLTSGLKDTRIPFGEMTVFRRKS